MANVPCSDDPRSLELRRAGDWLGLNEHLFQLAELEQSKPARLAYFREMAAIHEYELADLESAFVVQQAALRDDYTNTETVSEVERLAAAVHGHAALVAEYSGIVALLEKGDAGAANALREHLKRWRALADD